MTRGYDRRETNIRLTPAERYTRHVAEQRERREREWAETFPTHTEGIIEAGIADFLILHRHREIDQIQNRNLGVRMLQGSGVPGLAQMAKRLVKVHDIYSGLDILTARFGVHHRGQGIELCGWWDNTRTALAIIDGKRVAILSPNNRANRQWTLWKKDDETDCYQVSYEGEDNRLSALQSSVIKELLANPGPRYSFEEVAPFDTELLE